MMKCYFTLVAVIISSLCSIRGLAQWNLNAASPQLICTATGTQKLLQTIPDGSSGVYVFWLDNRSGNFDLYGQHYDGNGVKQWENEGRIILDENSAVYTYAITKYDNHFYVGWINGSNDSCFYQKLDLNGAPQWSNAALACNNDGTQISGIYGVRLVVNETGVICAVQYNIVGYVRIRLNHITHDGTVTGPLNGLQIGPLSFGTMNMTTDRYQGAYLYWSTGNGLGAPLKCVRIDSSLQNLWSGEIVPTAGSTGLGYGYMAVSDKDGVYFVWETGSDIMISRFDTSGVAQWNPAYKTACNSTYTEYRFHAANGNDGSLFVAWNDNRQPDQYQIYAQHIDKDGNLLWSDDGVEVFQKNYYQPYPHLAATDSGSVAVACYFNDGYWVDKLKADSSKAWMDSIKICASGLNPDDRDYSLLRSDSNLVTVWTASESGANNIYIAKVSSIDTIPNTTVGVKMLNASTGVEIFPNPGANLIHIKSPTDQYHIIARDALGRIMYSGEHYNHQTNINTSEWPVGMYMIQYWTENAQLPANVNWIKLK